MKKEMKKLPFSVYCVLMVILLSGCVRETWLVEESKEKVPVLFTSGFEQTIVTRVGGESGSIWDAADRVGVYMVEHGGALGDIVDGAENKPYKAATGGSTKTDLLPDVDTIYYPAADQVNFILYYPYTTAISGYNYPVDLSDQSVQEDIDLIYVHDQRPFDRYTKGRVELTFHHQLSKLVFLIGGGSLPSLSGLTFDIGGVSSQTTFDLSTGLLADLGVGGNETLHALVDTYIGDSVKAEAIVLPMADITATPVPLLITLNGKEYTAILPPVAGFTGIEAGYKYVYTVSVSDGSLRLSGVATPWNTVRGGDIPFDEEPGPMPAPVPPLPPLAIPMDMVYIPAGKFMMGSPIDEPGRHLTRETLHEVTLTKGFYMSRYETTNAQYATFLEAVGTNEEGRAMLEIDGYATMVRPVAPTLNMEWNGDTWQPVAGFENHPVVYISWYAATAFADWIGGSLPLEAQWEYACRAGTQTIWYFGDNSSDLDKYAWYEGNSGDELHAVGGKLPNAWGLYDMHGNVNERCCDPFEGDLGSDPVVDPGCSENSSSRVMRGGSYFTTTATVRSASRRNVNLSTSALDVGFRIVVNLP
jgi:formylglycine-generating enzyme required for sulfatase activity